MAQAAERAHVDLYFEAAVAGAIPVIRPLTQSLAGDTVLRVAGIVNGTTNYILSEMASTGADYASALADASALGYAEADPTADVEGYDAAAKAAAPSECPSAVVYSPRRAAWPVRAERYEPAGVPRRSGRHRAASRRLDAV